MPTLTSKNNTPMTSAAITTMVAQCFVSIFMSSGFCSMVTTCEEPNSLSPPNAKYALNATSACAARLVQ